MKAYMSIKMNSGSVTDIASKLGEEALTPSNLERVRTISYHDVNFYTSWLKYDDGINGCDLDTMLKEITCSVLLMQADATGMGKL